MAKENKNQAKASSVLATTVAKKGGKKNKKSGLPTWAGTVILVSALVLLIGIVAFSGMYSKGVFLHGKTVAETENFEVNAAMMSYVVYSEYQNFVSQYTSSDYGNMLSYIKGTGGESLDTSKPLRDQYYSKPTEKEPETATLTWFDYFANSAKASVEQVLVYCEVARHFGVGLEQSDYDIINATIEEIKIAARLQGYSTNEYLMAMYGKGVTEKEVRNIMELSQLAARMAEIKQVEFDNGVTDSRIDEELAANKDKYNIYTSYLGYTFTANFEVKGDGVDKEAANNEYVANQIKYKDRVEQLKNATTQKDFTNLITQWVYADTFESEKAAQLATNASEEDAIKKATEKAEAESLAAAVNAAVEHHQKADDENDLDKWLYDAGRAVGNTTTIVQESAAKNADGTFVDKASSTYSAYFMTETLHYDNKAVIRDAGHILFKTDTFDKLTDTSKLTGKIKEMADKIMARDGKISAAAMAEELIATMKAEGKLTEVTENGKTFWKMDKSAFEEYGLTYTEDANVIYEEVAPGDMVTEFNDWLFDDTRVVGEVSTPAVKTTYGYHIMTYLGNDKIQWRHNIATALSDADFSAWYSEESAKANVVFHDKAMKSITG